MGGLDGLWEAGGGVAGSAGDAEASLVRGVRRVEPVHGGRVVRPDRQDQDHALQSLAHLGEATLGLEVVVVAKGSLLLLAETVGDGVGGVDAGDAGHGVGDRLAVLDVETLDVGQGARVGAVVGDELGHDRDGLGGVDSQARAVEARVAHAVRVEVATVLVADSGVPAVTGTAVGLALAPRLSVNGAGVRSVCGGDEVGLPDVHL